MSQIQITVDELNKMQALDIVESPIVREKFIQIYDTIWGEGTGAAAYERESVYFNKLLRDTDNGKLLKATHFSIFTAFIDIAVNGLSLEPGTRALAYLIGKNHNIGTKDRPVWEGRLVLTISAYGELVMRARAGQIRHADNPVLVYEGDEFSFSDRGGRKEVDYVCHLPHNGKRVIACYLRITRADGSIDYSVMTEEDWVRLANFSARQNKNGGANALYGVDGQGVCHIDTGFLMAKCIKHAFKSYPKLRIGRGTELQSQQPDAETEINDELYGISEQPANPAQDTQPFGNIEQPTGVTVDTGDDDGAF